MRARPECIPCSLKQAYLNAKQVTADEETALKSMRAAMEYLITADLDRSPAEISTICAIKACQVLECNDPFAGEKKRYNRIALDMVPELTKLLDESKDRLYCAIMLAAAGNIIDLGIFTDVDVKETVKNVLAKGLVIDDSGRFAGEISRGKSLLYIGDNAGEIVFDRLLIEELVRRGLNVTFAVRSGPISNDVTWADAEAVGMDRFARVISTGTDFMGIYPDRCSSEFWDIFNSSDLIISKGHANFETLEVKHMGLFYLLTAKCEIVAGELGVNIGDTVFSKAC